MMMAASFVSFLLAPLLILTGGRADLLDLIPSEDYWRAQSVEVSVERMLDTVKTEKVGDVSDLIAKLGHNDFAVREDAERRLTDMGPTVLPQVKAATEHADPEVAMRAGRIVTGASGNSAGPAVRRLMAIRTLGELKDKAALPALRGLLESDEPFVKDYAARAIASIEGKTWALPATEDAVMAADLSLMPADSAAVAQARMIEGPAPSIDRFLAQVREMGMPIPDNAKAEVIEELIKAADRLGNIRVDSGTVALSSEIDSDQGWVVTHLRGQYTPSFLMGMIRQETTREPEKIEGYDVLVPDRNVAIALVGDDRLVFVAGAQEKDVREQLTATLKALKAGKGNFAENKGLAKLLEKVDRSKPVWAVAQLNETYRKVPYLQPFHALLLEAELTDGAVKAAVHAEGEDAEAVKRTADSFVGMLTATYMMLKTETAGKPGFKPLLDAFSSIKVSAEGTRATVSGEAKDAATLMGGLPMMFFWGFSARMQIDAMHAVEVEAMPAVPDAVEIIED